MRYCTGGDSRDTALRLIQENVGLQIALAKFRKMPGYLERIPVVPDGPVSRDAQAAQLALLFANVSETDDFPGVPLFEVYGPRPCVQPLWETACANGWIDPLLLHFSGRRAAQDAPDADGIRVFQCSPDDCACLKQDMDGFASQPFVRAIRSNDLYAANLPAIDVTGWTLGALCADADAELLCRSVKRLYYCVFPTDHAFSRQLRYAL